MSWLRASAVQLLWEVEGEGRAFSLLCSISLLWAMMWYKDAITKAETTEQVGVIRSISAPFSRTIASESSLSPPQAGLPPSCQPLQSLPTWQPEKGSVTGENFHRALSEPKNLLLYWKKILILISSLENLTKEWLCPFYRKATLAQRGYETWSQS